MNRQQKLQIAKSNTANKPQVEVGFFQSKDLEDIHTKFTGLQETIVGLIGVLTETAEQDRSAETEAIATKLETLGDRLVTTILNLEAVSQTRDKKLIESMSKIASSIPALPSKMTVANPTDIPKWLKTPVSIDKISRQLDLLAENLKPAQEPGSFVPYRRVRKQGNRLVFDDTDWTSSPGGGGGGVQEIGANHMDTGQKSLDGTPSAIVAAREGRRGVLITNLGAVDVYLGSDSSVSTATGSLLLGTKGTAIFVPTTTAVYAVTGGSTVSISYIEVY